MSYNADGNNGFNKLIGAPLPPGKTTNILPASPGGIGYVGHKNDLGVNDHANDSAGKTNPGGNVGTVDNLSNIILTTSNAS